MIAANATAYTEDLPVTAAEEYFDLTDRRP